MNFRKSQEILQILDKDIPKKFDFEEPLNNNAKSGSIFSTVILYVILSIARTRVVNWPTTSSLNTKI